MSGLQTFIQTHGEGQDFEPAADDVIQKYAKKVPRTLVEHWKNYGWRSYTDQFLWITNPALFESILKLWFKDKSTKRVVIVRTGFGHLFLWNGKSIELLHVHFGGVSEVSSDFDLFFSYSLCSNRYLDRGLDRKTFVKAKKKLGPLSTDECFGYEPALALGGSGKLSTIRKYKLLEHLAFLAQLVT
jgi:hypothetical protein